MKSVLLMIAATTVLGAQEFKFPANLDRLAAKAKESVVVDLDSQQLQLAGKFLSTKDAKEATAKKLVAGLKAIHVRTFEFDQPGQYTQADLESVRALLKAPEWTRIVNVRSGKGAETAEVYLRTENNQVAGLAVIAAEPRELAVVNIVGPIDPDQLSMLGGQFGIPKMELSHGGKD